MSGIPVCCVLRECSFHVYTRARALLSGWFGCRVSVRVTAAGGREFPVARPDLGRDLAVPSCTAGPACTLSRCTLSKLVPAEPDLRNVRDTSERCQAPSHTSRWE